VADTKTDTNSAKETQSNCLPQRQKTLSNEMTCVCGGTRDALTG